MNNIKVHVCELLFFLNKNAFAFLEHSHEKKKKLNCVRLCQDIYSGWVLACNRAIIPFDIYIYIFFFFGFYFWYRVIDVCEMKIDKYRPCDSMSPLFTSEIRQPPTLEHPVSLDDICNMYFPMFKMYATFNFGVVVGLKRRG